MNRSIKKAFTLVELLVVIAILAILGTVGVVGYTSFTKRAKYSNDTSLVTEWNTLLDGKDILADSNSNEKLDNIAEVKDYFIENGSINSDFTPASSGYHFYWSEIDNNVYLVDDDNNSFNIVYPETSNNITKDNSYKLNDTYYSILTNIENATLNKTFILGNEENATITLETDNLPNYVSVTGATLDSYSYTDGTLEISSFTDNVVISECTFGPQYKYEINQLAKYMNMDGNRLQNLLLNWTSDASNRNKTYGELLSDIETKDDALCVSAIYILGTEHFIVTNSTALNNVSGKDFSKALLQSDVLFKKINIFFNLANTSDEPDSTFINGLPSSVLRPMNEEFEKCNGGENVSVCVCDIYDAFKDSIDHAEEESPVGNTYTLTANAIYKLLNIYSTSNMSLDDVKDSMNRMIAKAKNETILEEDFIDTFENKTNEIKQQMAYDYTIYCYMCMFGLMSGDSAYTALSEYYSTKEFTSLDAIGYVLGSDYLFNSLAQIHNVLQNELQDGYIENIMSTSYSKLSSNLISDIYAKYTDNYGDMYKAIAKIFED